MDPDFQPSVENLQEQLNRVQAKKPQFLAIGQDLLTDLAARNLTPLARSEQFDEVAGSILKAQGRHDAKISSKVTTWLSKLAPLASIALGVTGFVAEAAPVPALSLVVTGLGAVLSFAEKEGQRSESVVKQLESISYNRRSVERVVDANKTGDADLTSACMMTFVELNNFLAISIRYLSTTLFLRLFQGLSASSVDERSAALNAAFTNFDRVLQHTVNLIVLEDNENRLHQELLSSFGPLPLSEFSREQDRLLSNLCAGTGDWFLDSDQVKAFLNGDISWLWCQGQAGVGKSYLASRVINHLEIQLPRINSGPVSELAILAYVFCHNNHVRKAEGDYMDALLGAIAAQVLRHRSNNLLRLGNAFRDQHKHKATRGADYMAFVKSTLPYIRTLYLIVDAIDEIGQASLVSVFARNLGWLLDDSENKVRLLTTTRPGIVPQDNSIFDLPSVKVMNVETGVEDLQTYIQQRIDAAPPQFFSLPKDLRDEIVATVVPRKQARKSWRAPGCLSRLKPDVDAYYDDAVARIGKAEVVMRLMLWILILPRAITERQLATWQSIHPTQRKGPLHIQELLHAIAISGISRPESLVSMRSFLPESIPSLVGGSGGLCVMNPAEDTVSYAHPTVQQYLLRRRTSLFPNIEVDRCRACIAYLSLKDFESGACKTRLEWNNRLEKFPILEYAARHWCQVLGFDQDSEEVNRQVEDLIVQLLSHDGLRANLAQCQAYSNGWMGVKSIHISRTTALLVAMQFNLMGVMTKLLYSNVNQLEFYVNEQNEAGQTALDLAVTAGPEWTALLLDHDAEVRSDADPRRGRKARSALDVALAYLSNQIRNRVVDGVWSHSHLEVVKLLLRHDPTLTVDVRSVAESSLGWLSRYKYRTMMPDVDFDLEEGQYVDARLAKERFEVMELESLQKMLDAEQSARRQQRWWEKWQPRRRTASTFMETTVSDSHSDSDSDSDSETDRAALAQQMGNLRVRRGQLRDVVGPATRRRIKEERPMMEE
ncbi:uncharacterized protein AB675_11107 [Cyphellophora attinorum]|uniref:Nephrocystin 3-like N-terminal domain-containing protein n=1 Tax=Cyphellophora attinorum TaxID=1664694 RepID=A0A0N0NIJ5_9EURO|nr:uncharacterized protein AB675_11107 [Phialophora attinorum]KPI35818.1 hypothetical protein AB675_11107 [Phialophora attinorum]